jgi:hypothetical protein
MARPLRTVSAWRSVHGDRMDSTTVTYPAFTTARQKGLQSDFQDDIRKSRLTLLWSAYV